MCYKCRNEISWCSLGGAIYVINERNNEVSVLKGKLQRVFIKAISKLNLDEDDIVVADVLIKRDIIEEDFESSTTGVLV